MTQNFALRAIIIIFFSISILGCNRKPYYQCEKAVDHIIDIRQTDDNVRYGGEVSEYMKESCKKYPLTDTEYKCIILATTSAGVNECLKNQP